METITNLRLHQVKEKFLKQNENSPRFILKGNNPILLTTTVLIPNKNDIEKSNQMGNYSYMPYMRSSYTNHSYLDALIAILNQQSDIHGIIHYEPIELENSAVNNQLETKKYYYDELMKKYIQKHEIDVLISLVIGQWQGNKKPLINEKMSSFSVMGLTGVTKKLSTLFDKYEIPHYDGFGCGISNEEYQRLGYEYTDDTIDYNHFFNLGVKKNQKLERDSIWPRTVELNLNSSMTDEELEKLGNALLEYFVWVEKEIKTKGFYHAMSPMGTKVNIKK